MTNQVQTASNCGPSSALSLSLNNLPIRSRVRVAARARAQLRNNFDEWTFVFVFPIPHLTNDWSEKLARWLDTQSCYIMNGRPTGLFYLFTFKKKP